MNVFETSEYMARQRAPDQWRTLQIDTLKLVIALSAELVIFLLWLDAPPRERYEVLAHIVLPLCIVFPIVNYRYLIFVPFIAFLPDIARAFGIEMSHSLLILPLVFLAALLPFLSKLKAAVIVAYAAAAVVASHFIADARPHAVIYNAGAYPWSDLLLYSFFLTVTGFLLLQMWQVTDVRRTARRTARA
jgi:hypothetical protein